MNSDLTLLCLHRYWWNLSIFYRLVENPNYGSVDADDFMNSSPTMTGPFVRQPSTGSGKQLVYCIHGKPSGCCATLVSTDDTNSNRKKPDQTDGKSSITICKCSHKNRVSLKKKLLEGNYSAIYLISQKQYLRKYLMFSIILNILYMIIGCTL